MTILGDSYFKRGTIFGEIEILSYQTDDFGSIPQIVYKYLDLSKLHNRNSLLEDYLWFSDPTAFNDPFDCKAWFAFHLLAEDESLCRDYYEYHIPLKNPNFSNVQKKALIDHSVNGMLSKKSNIDFFKNLEKNIAKERIEDIKQFGIFCTCMLNNNILLWSHYANNHTGVCLGLKADKLLEKYYNNGEMGAGEVKYDKFPVIAPIHSRDENAITATFQQFFLTKAPFWNYELEYRFLDYPCTNRKKIIGDLLESIYMGCDISSSDEIFIKEICRKSDGRIKLYKAEKAYFKYEIEFREETY